MTPPGTPGGRGQPPDRSPFAGTNLHVGGHPVRVHDPATVPPGVAILLHDGDAGTHPADLTALGVTVVEVLESAHFWMTPAGEAWVSETLAPWALARWGVPHVALVGFGVAGHAALRLAFRAAGLFPVVAAESAAVDLHDYYGTGTPLDGVYDSREACRQDSALLSVRQSRTPPHVAFACPPPHAHSRGNDRLREKLNAIGVAHTFVEQPEATAALAGFVAAGLRQHARRLL